jgi:hypothetical protein
MAEKRALRVPLALGEQTDTGAAWERVVAAVEPGTGRSSNLDVALRQRAVGALRDALTASDGFHQFADHLGGHPDGENCYAATKIAEQGLQEAWTRAAEHGGGPGAGRRRAARRLGGATATVGIRTADDLSEKEAAKEAARAPNFVRGVAAG